MSSKPESKLNSTCPWFPTSSKFISWMPCKTMPPSWLEFLTTLWVMICKLSSFKTWKLYSRNWRATTKANCTLPGWTTMISPSGTGDMLRSQIKCHLSWSRREPSTGHQTTSFLLAESAMNASKTLSRLRSVLKTSKHSSINTFLLSWFQTCWCTKTSLKVKPSHPSKKSFSKTWSMWRKSAQLMLRGLPMIQLNMTLQWSPVNKHLIIALWEPRHWTRCWLKTKTYSTKLKCISWTLLKMKFTCETWRLTEFRSSHTTKDR